MVSILERRRIEAQFARAVIDALARRMPRQEALAIVAEAVLAMAKQAGSDQARSAASRDLAGLATLIPLWQQDDALEIEWRERSPDRLEFDVTRCRYAEMYRESGLADLGVLLSCNRDAAFGEGFNPDIGLERPETIMLGATRCAFRYRLRDAGAPTSAAGDDAGAPGPRTAGETSETDS